MSNRYYESGATLVAALSYLAARGEPAAPAAIAAHDCLGTSYIAGAERPAPTGPEEASAYR